MAIKLRIRAVGSCSHRTSHFTVAIPVPAFSNLQPTAYSPLLSPPAGPGPVTWRTISQQPGEKQINKTPGRSGHCHLMRTCPDIGVWLGNVFQARLLDPRCWLAIAYAGHSSFGPALKFSAGVQCKQTGCRTKLCVLICAGLMSWRPCCRCSQNRFAAQKCCRLLRHGLPPLTGL